MSAPAARGGAPPAKHAEGLIGSKEAGWPQWRGPYRDGICDEKGLLPAWPEGGPKLLWRADGLGQGWSSPIIAGGALYITGDVSKPIPPDVRKKVLDEIPKDLSPRLRQRRFAEKLRKLASPELYIFAFTLDGKRKWRVKNGRAWTRSHPGARASCAFSEGRLYHMNAHGRMVCLDPKTAREIWTVNVLERFEGRNITWALSECLLIDGDRVIVTPGGRKGLMAALDKKTGRTVWASEAVAGEKAGYASPILFEYGGLRHIVGCSSRHAFGVNADTGKLLWRKPRPTRFEVIASVPVYHDGTVFAASPDGKESELFRLHVEGNQVRAEPVWSCDLNNLSGGVILLDGRLYGGGYRRFDYWLCVDHKTGKTRYAQRDLNSGAAVYADGRLYCFSERGEMALLEPGPGGFKTHGRFRLIQPRRPDAWAHPVIHAARLYLRYHDTLWCYDIRAL